MPALKLCPDLGQAQAFLEALEPDGLFTFQTFTERNKNDHTHPPVILHGKLTQHAARLTTLNNAGHGIFVQINAGDLKGRANKNIVRIRAYFVDSDNGPIQPVMAAAVPPNIVVESSPGKGHGYFLTNDGELEMFKIRQKALAAYFDGDPSVCDLARVMRLPGFFHLKSATPFMTRLIKPTP